MKKEPINILHIEDNPLDVILVLDELNQYWAKINHRKVEKLVDLEDALKTKWDVILSDFSLPEFDGLTALRIVRENEIDTPFIVVSGRVEEDIAASMMRLGANDYVMKDNLKRLGPAIARELKTAEEREQSGLKLSGVIKYGTRPHTKVKKVEELAFPKPGSIAPLLELSTSGFVKERHKAVVNILYAANLIRRTQEALLQKENLSEPQFNILSILRRQLPQAISITMIKDEIPNKTIDVSRTIDRMGKAGLLNYAINNEKRSIRDISISEQGLKALSEIDKCADEMFLSDAILSEEQATQVNLGLQQMLSSMQQPN